MARLYTFVMLICVSKSMCVESVVVELALADILAEVQGDEMR